MYEGLWHNNNKHFYGFEYSVTSAYYKGEFKNGLKSGIGTYYLADGSKYEGEWENNNIHGFVHIFITIREFITLRIIGNIKANGLLIKWTDMVNIFGLMEKYT